MKLAGDAYCIDTNANDFKYDSCWFGVTLPYHSIKLYVDQNTLAIS
jgi:hypothetical protein